MLGIILISLGTFFEEISHSIGKTKVLSREQTPYTMAFLSIFWGLIFFVLIFLFKGESFIFKLSSLPTFIPGAILNIIQLYISVSAIVKADRTTYSFIRTLTIPLLFMVDLTLGYSLGQPQILGILLIMTTLFIILKNQGVKKDGIGLVTFTAVNAAATISLYKYNITHFNSVVAEQLIMNVILLASSLIFGVVKTKENPLPFLLKPVFFFQSFSLGLAAVVASFAYNYGPASIIIAANRSSAIFWTLFSGRVYFQEKNLAIKSFIFLALAAGLVLLALN